MLKAGVLGISLGGQTALRAAARSGAIGAVVAKGPSPATLADHGGRPATLLRWLNYPANWLYYAVLSFMNGVKPPPGIVATVRDIAPRPILLISTGRGKEQRFARMIYEAALEPKDLWELPQARHSGGYFLDKAAYAAKVGRFFDAALAGKPPDGAAPGAHNNAH